MSLWFLCADCRYFARNFDGLEASSKCRRPVTAERNLVTGETPRLNSDAKRERRGGQTFFGRERCGVGAKFFERVERQSFGVAGAPDR